MQVKKINYNYYQFIELVQSGKLKRENSLFAHPP